MSEEKTWEDMLGPDGPGLSSEDDRDEWIEFLAQQEGDDEGDWIQAMVVQMGPDMVARFRYADGREELFDLRVRREIAPNQDPSTGN